VVEVVLEANFNEEEVSKKDHQEAEVDLKFLYNSIVCQAFMLPEELRSV